MPVPATVAASQTTAGEVKEMEMANPNDAKTVIAEAIQAELVEHGLPRLPRDIDPEPESYTVEAVTPLETRIRVQLPNGARFFVVQVSEMP